MKGIVNGCIIIYSILYKLLCSLSQILQGLIQNTVEVNCETGWLKHENSCYWFSDDVTNWDDAEKACKGKQSHLVTIQSEDEHKFVVQNRKDKNVDTWIGAHQNGTDLNNWYWSNGEIFRFQNWLYGQPDLVDQKCASIYGDSANHLNLWHDINCDGAFRYVCEK